MPVTPPYTSIGDSLRGTLGTWLPTWLGNVPGLRNLFYTLWTVALLADEFREIAWEGELAAYPGVGTQDALGYIGASRGLIQGPAETNVQYAIRLINWLPTVAQMGNPEGLCLQVQAFLISQGSLGANNYPIVTFVDRSGNVTTANADRTITEGTFSFGWNWDDRGGWVDNIGYKDPTYVEGFWSDGWLIVQDMYEHYTGFSDANWLAAWDSGDQTVDSLCPQIVVSGLQQIVDTWKGAHVYVRCIVWDRLPSSFVPTGWYGNWSSNQNGTQAARRNGALSYWQPVQGR